MINQKYFLSAYYLPGMAAGSKDTSPTLIEKTIGSSLQGE